MRIDALEWPSFHRIAKSDLGEESHADMAVTDNLQTEA